MTKFADWLLNELKKRNMSQADLSKASGVSNAQISRVLAGTRGIGTDALTKISRVLQLPSETVLRAAGLLPPQSPESELINSIVHLTSELPPEDQTDILAYTQMRHRLAEERGKYDVKQGTKKATTKPKQA